MADKIIRVAQVIGMAAYGGVESCIMNYYRHIDRNKVQFDFFVESENGIINNEEIDKLGGRIILIPHYTHFSSFMKVLKKKFKEGNYDIVHSNMNALSVFVLRAAKSAGIKVRIAHSHSTSNKKEWKKTIVKNLLRPYSKKYATDYFACSELAGRWLFGNKTYDAGKVQIINNAIDLEKFKFDDVARSEIRKKIDLDDKFAVGHVGRFMQQKNHSFLLDIFYEIRKRKNDAILLLIGDGPLFDEIKNKVKLLCMENSVIFVGNVHDANRYYSAMDCFVLPSLYEGLPVVGVEAQINGLKCLFSTDITNEIKITAGAEFESLKSSPIDWAEKIINSECPNREGAFRCFLKSKYDLENEAVKLQKIYEELVIGSM